MVSGSKITSLVFRVVPDNTPVPGGDADTVIVEKDTGAAVLQTIIGMKGQYFHPILGHQVGMFPLR